MQILFHLIKILIPYLLNFQSSGRPPDQFLKYYILLARLLRSVAFFVFMGISLILILIFSLGLLIYGIYLLHPLEPQTLGILCITVGSVFFVAIGVIFWKGFSESLWIKAFGIDRLIEDLDQPAPPSPPSLFN